MKVCNLNEQKDSISLAHNKSSKQHPSMAPYHGTQQWRHVQSVKVCHNHPPPIASSNGTLPHGTTSSLSKCVITTPRRLHPAMAPSNGTLPHGAQQWHHVHTANVQSPRQQWHPAMAPYHGTLSSNGTLPWHLTTWHLAMAPSNGSFCSSRQLAHPPPPTWHLAMAHSNGSF